MRIARTPAFALVAGLGLFAGVSGAGAAKAPPVTCGSTLTTSTTLQKDLKCPATGLVIGADGITVDLNGHTISGSNAAGGEGIASDGHSHLRIQDGRITGFRLNGVGIRGGSDNLVRDLTIRRIGDGGAEGEPVSAGIYVSGSPGARLLGNDVANAVAAFQSDGAVVIDSPGTVVQGNRLDRNAWNGLALLGSPDSRIVANELDGNGNNGTEVNGGSDRTVVSGNAAHGNKLFGIVAGSGRGIRVIGNDAGRNETGLFFFDLHDGLISGNTAWGNTEGIDLFGGQFGSDGNRVTGNNASANDGAGIVVADGADDNLVSGNTANDNKGPIDQGGGIIVAAATGNRVIGNVANRNLDTGIGVFEDQPGDSPGNTLKGNQAFKNANHGMDAVAGTIDGGGNRASGNATPPQCVNVTCAR